jgi:hypothetical protein
MEERDRMRNEEVTFTPATEEEAAEAVEASGMRDLDDTPEGTRVFQGYGELISELERSINRGKRTVGS